MPRFALLAHDYPTPHFDLMLERDGTLRTWRIALIPKLGETLTAEAIGDHRLDYLDYEGPVSGNRGTVRRIDSGGIEWHVATPNEVVVILNGQLLCGQLELRSAGDHWTCSLTR